MPSDLVLTIRREQIRAMAAPQIERFLSRARDHVAEQFPEQHAALSAAELSDAVRHGFERASEYGLESERDLLRYQTLMFFFGRDFDRDPRFPWARQILTGPGTPAEKTSHLQTEALRALDTGRGYRAIPADPV